MTWLRAELELMGYRKEQFNSFRSVNFDQHYTNNSKSECYHESKYSSKLSFVHKQTVFMLDESAKIQI